MIHLVELWLASKSTAVTIDRLTATRKRRHILGLAESEGNTGVKQFLSGILHYRNPLPKSFIPFPRQRRFPAGLVPWTESSSILNDGRSGLLCSFALELVGGPCSCHPR